jgi:hypothetical protein
MTWLLVNALYTLSRTACAPAAAVHPPSPHAGFPREPQAQLGRGDLPRRGRRARGIEAALAEDLRQEVGDAAEEHVRVSKVSRDACVLRWLPHDATPDLLTGPTQSITATMAVSDVWPGTDTTSRHASHLGVSILATHRGVIKRQTDSAEDSVDLSDGH